MSGEIVNILLLACVAAMYPTLLAAVATMLMLPSPKRLMFGYLLGAWMTSITLGMVIVFALGGSSGATSSGESSIGPGLDFAFGFLFLVGAWALAGGRDERIQRRRRERKEAKASDEPERPALPQRLLSRGSPRITFVAGLILSVPGVTYLLALRHISTLDASDAGKAVLVISFCLIQLLLLELPLLAYVFAPERTQAAVARFRAWLAGNARRIATIGLAAIGLLLILRGVLELL